GIRAGAHRAAGGVLALPPPHPAPANADPSARSLSPRHGHRAMTPLAVRERLDPQRACLVVVDMQNDFCDPSGAIYQAYHLDVSASTEILPRVCALIEAAHATNVPVIFTRMVNDATTESPAFRG